MRKNMTKSMAVMSAFLIGSGLCSQGNSAMAAQNGNNKSMLEVGEKRLPKENIDFFHTEELQLPKDYANLLDVGGGKTSAESSGHKNDKSNEETAEKDVDKTTAITSEIDEAVGADEVLRGDEAVGADEVLREDEALDTDVMSEMKNLQIPEKLAVVIDPWELDGKGQIYSEPYVIKNTGETPGILKLSNLTCKPWEGSEVSVRTDKAGLHGDEEKSIYIEMLFGDGNQIVLSEESAEYEALLKPGEELEVWFTGEVNEYASDGWGNSDFSIGVVYSWDTENVPEDVLAEGAEDSALDSDNDEPEKVEETTEGQEAGEDENGLWEDESGSNADSLMQTELESLPGIDEALLEINPEEGMKTIDLQGVRKSQMAISSWTVEENGRLYSEEYILRNTGESSGVLTLSGLTGKTPEGSGIRIRTEKEEQVETEEGSVYIELELGNGEKVTLSGEAQETQESKIELGPGEELSVRFVGELNGVAPEELENGEFEAAAVCTWALEEQVLEGTE